jgi:hypothetical protein
MTQRKAPPKHLALLALGAAMAGGSGSNQAAIEYILSPGLQLYQETLLASGEIDSLVAAITALMEGGLDQ